MLNILITGANGQLGRSLQRLGGVSPHNYICTDVAELDITDAGAVLRAVREQGIDVIVNCAAYTDVEKAEEDEARADLLNHKAAGNLAAAAKETGATLFHVSTDYVFDGTGHRPYTEDMATSPLGAYGRTKLAGEEAVKASGCRYLILRTAWLYSEFGNNFVKTMLRLAGEGKTPSVVDDQYGTPTYATDLARALMVLVQRPGEDMELFHYTDGGETTWYDFAVEIFRQADMPVAVVPVDTAGYPTAARRPHYSVLDKSRIAAVGAVLPDWRASLRTCLDILLPQNGDK